MMEQEFCTVCNDLVTPEIIEEDRTIHDHDRSVTINIPIAVCPKCHKIEFVLPETWDKTLRMVKEKFKELEVGRNGRDKN